MFWKDSGIFDKPHESNFESESEVSEPNTPPKPNPTTRF